MLMTGDIGDFRDILLFEIPCGDETVHGIAANKRLDIGGRECAIKDANIGNLTG